MSRFEFKLPDIGEGVSEGEIVGWLVHVGDAVSENQDMVEVMTDKATVTIGAPKPGKVVEIRGGEGDVVPVGTVLVVLEVAGDAASAPGAKSSERSSHNNAKPAPAPANAKSAPANVAPSAGHAHAVVASAVGDIKDDLPGVPKAPREVADD